MKQKLKALRNKAMTDNALNESVQIDVSEVHKKIKFENTWLKCYIEELRKAYTLPILLLTIISIVLGVMNETQRFVIVTSLVILAIHMFMVFIKNKDYIANRVKAVHKDGVFVDVITNEGTEQVLVSELNVDDKIKLSKGMTAPCKLRVIKGSVSINGYNVFGKSVKAVEDTVIYADSVILDMSDDAEVCVADDINRERRLSYRRRFKSKTLRRFFAGLSLISSLGILFMLLMSWVYALTPYNTVLNLMIGVVSVVPMCYMLALVNIPSHKNMSFIRYVKNVLCLGTTDIIAFDVKDITATDKYKAYDIKFITEDGEIVTSSQLNNKKGELFKKFTQVAKKTLTLVPALEALDIFSSAQERQYDDYVITEYDDKVIYEGKFNDTIKATLSQGYMLFTCKVSDRVVGMLCIKHFVTVDVKTVAKVLTKYGVSLQLVSSEPKYYVDSVVTQIQGGKPLEESLFSVHYMGDSAERRTYYKELAKQGKSVCHLGSRNTLLGNYGSFSTVNIGVKRCFYVDDFNGIQEMLLNAKNTFQYLKDIMKYVLACSMGKLLSIIIATVIGINYIMPLAFYMLADVFMMVSVSLLYVDKKTIHKTGSVLMTADDVVSVLFNGVLLGMSMIFSFLMMLRWYSLGSMFSAECITLYWTIVFQTMIAVVMWFKQGIKKFVERNVLLMMTIAVTLVAFIIAFRNTKVVILGVTMTALFCGLNMIYNKIFKVNK